MKVNQSKQRLPLELRKLDIKLSALFFKKLILSEEEQDSERKVQHYDLQCEGVEMILGFFKTKHQNNLLKAFIAIRSYRPSKTQSSARGTQKHLNGNTGRTYLNTTYTVSQPVSSRPQASMKSLRNLLSKQEGQTSSRCSGDLEQLLKKVKETNSRYDGSSSYRESEGSERGENYGFYLNQRSHNLLSHPSFAQSSSRMKAPSYSGHSSSYYNYQPRSFNHLPATMNQNCYQCQKSSRKGSRREFILDKFNNIENGLNTLQNRKETRCRLNNDVMNQLLTIKQRLRL